MSVKSALLSIILLKFLTLSKNVQSTTPDPNFVQMHCCDIYFKGSDVYINGIWANKFSSPDDSLEIFNCQLYKSSNSSEIVNPNNNLVGQNPATFIRFSKILYLEGLISQCNQYIHSLNLTIQGSLELSNLTVISPDFFHITVKQDSSLFLNSLIFSSKAPSLHLIPNTLSFDFISIKKHSEFFKVSLTSHLKTNLSMRFEGSPLPLNIPASEIIYYSNPSSFTRLLSNSNCDNGYIGLKNEFNNIECYPCPESSYSFQGLNLNLCFQCSDCMICENQKIRPKEGCWRDKDNPYIFRKCPNDDKEVCKSEEGNSFTVCGKGYENDYCDQCSDGYGKIGSHKCKECPNNVLNAFVIIFIVIMISIVIIVMIKATIISAFEPSQLYSIGIKIGINYFQIIYLCFQYKLKWPENLTGLNNKNDGTDVSSEITFFVSLKCLFNKDGDDQTIYYGKIGFMMLVPVLLYLLSWLYLLVLWLSNRIKNVASYKTVSLIIPFLLAYPYIITYALSPLACQSIESGQPQYFDEGIDNFNEHKYLIDMQSIKCNWVDHFSKVFIPSSFGILVWGLLVPFYIFKKLRELRKNLFDYNAKIKFGFLFNGYLHERYYWEFIVLIKKLFIVFLTVFVQSGYNPNLQSVLLVSFLISCFILQLYFKPYFNKELNDLDIFSATAALITVLTGISYSQSKPGSVVMYFCMVIIFVVNLSFFLYWFRFMTREMVNFIILRVEFLRKRFSSTDGFDKNMSKEFNEIDYIYVKEHQKLFTQITNLDNPPELLGDFETLKSLYLSIIKESLETYNKNQGPRPPRNTIRRQSTIQRFRPNFYLA